RHKVADQLVKMTEAKDLKVLERLAALADPLQLNEREAREARQDCCERLGSRSQPGTLAASLTAAMAPCLISPACLAALAVLAYPTTNRHPPPPLGQSARSPAAAQVWSQLQVGAEVQGLCGALKVLSSCMKSFTEAAGAGAV
ncbi:uncharacterized protein HaLaN_05712, partial [Haematococcus lacustris]